MAEDQDLEYRNVGTHPEDLHDGRIVEVGGFVILTAEELREPHNQRLVAENVLIPTGGKQAEHEAQLATRREKSRTETGGE
jgi:hypothetical protein